MAGTVWKGYLTFGMISVPIRLHVAARDERVGFNQIHRVCGSRIKQQVEDGDPDVGYQLNSLTGAQAQEAVREMREEALRRTRRR